MIQMNSAFDIRPVSLFRQPHASAWMFHETAGDASLGGRSHTAME